MPRAIIRLAIIEIATASTEINASWRCRRRNGSSADDSGCCRTAVTAPPARAGSGRMRVKAPSLCSELPASSRPAKRSASTSLSNAARSSSSSVLACRRQGSLPWRLRNDTCCPVKRLRSCASASFTPNPSATQAIGSGASTGTSTSSYRRPRNRTIAALSCAASAFASSAGKGNVAPIVAPSVSAITRWSSPTSIITSASMRRPWFDSTDVIVSASPVAIASRNA